MTQNWARWKCPIRAPFSPRWIFPHERNSHRKSEAMTAALGRSLRRIHAAATARQASASAHARAGSTSAKRTSDRFQA